MQVQVNTDNHVEGHEELIREVQATVEDALGRFSDRLTRIEVHLKDVNSHKGGADDKHCTIEARPAGMQPIAVTASAATVDEAVDGAVKKLRTSLDRTFGRIDDHKGRTPTGGEPGI
jgi:ribosome-associated translation inhibitor RaiA